MHVLQHASGVNASRARAAREAVHHLAPAVVGSARRAELLHRLVKLECLRGLVADQADFELRREYLSTGAMDEADDDERGSTVEAVWIWGAVNTAALHFAAGSAQFVPRLRNLL